MNLKSVSLVSLIFAAAVSGLVGSRALEGRELMMAKAQTQAQAASDFQEWKHQYTQLMPLEARWQEAFHSIAEVKDLFSLHRLLGNTPQSNPDTLVVDKIERLIVNDKDLGAQWVCVSSLAAAGIEFIEPDFTTLMAGLSHLAKRPDIQMGEISLSQKEGNARAVVQPFCLLLRDSEGTN